MTATNTSETATAAPQVAATAAPQVAAEFDLNTAEHSHAYLDIPVSFEDEQLILAAQNEILVRNMGSADINL